MTEEHDDIDDAADIPDAALRSYYEDAIDVWEDMAVFEGAESLIVPGTASNNARAWYKYSDNHGQIDAPADIDDAADILAGRPWSARADRDQIVDELLDWDYRLPHLTINYQHRSPDEWQTKVYEDDSSEWIDGRPLPEYRDVDAVALFADVDFAAGAKERPADDQTRDRVETILEHWRDAYAGVVEDRDAVGILDSVGGTYVMLRPAVTAPIASLAADRLDDADRHHLMKELQARWRRFNEQVDADADDWDAFAQDGDTNINRLYKAPLAIHKSIPGVVTPIDVDDPNFELTRWSDIDDELIEEVSDWVDWFTDTEPSKSDDWAGALLEQLFDDVDADSWRDDITSWAEERSEADQTGQTNTLEDIDIDPKELAANITFVSDRSAVWSKISSLDCETVASELNIISDSDHAESDDATRIEVNWRQSDSGDSAIVNSDQFSDMDGMEGKGGPADLVAYTLLKSNNQEPDNWRSDPESIETVLDWFLSSKFDVPVYIPESGSEYQDDGDTKQFTQTPNWAMRRVAELLDIAPESAFDNDTDACIVPSLYNRILDVLDAADVQHNRDRQDVRVGAQGDDVKAQELDLDIPSIIAESPADIHADDDSEGSDGSEQDDDPDTWTETYGIPERDGVTDIDHKVAAPGVDLQWLELADGRAGWGWRHEYTTEDGEHRENYQFVVNADLELLSRLDYPDKRDHETEWQIRINPTIAGEPTREITVTTAAFNSARELRNELIGKTESVVFNAHGKGAKAVNELKQLVNAQAAPRRKAHEKIELVEADDDRPVMITPKGTIDADGWVDEPRHVFQGIADGIQGDWKADPDVIEQTDGNLVGEVCELLPKIRDDRQQWLSMLGFAFASCYRPLLFDQAASGVDTWNLMHVSGKTGAGKSGVAKTLSGALGMNSNSTTGAEKTSHAQEHMFSATNGMPVAMDEYNPQNWANWKADTFHELLKKSTDGQSIEKGNADQSLTEYRFEVSPIVLGEQQLPEDMAALPRRAVPVTLQTLSTARGTETSERFNQLRELKDDDWGLGLHHHAIDWWSHVCNEAESTIDVVNKWHETEDWVKTQLEDRGIDINAEMPRDMHQQGLQTVAFGLRNWREFAIQHGADTDMLFDDSDIIDTLELLIEEQTGEHASSVDNESAMLETLADAAAIRSDAGEFSSASQEYVEYGDHYTLVNLDTNEPTELRIHLKSTLTQLSKFKRDYDIDSSLYQRSDYYRWFKSSAADPDSMVIGSSQRTYLNDAQKRCISIDFEQLTDTLDIHESDLVPSWVIPGEDDTIEDSDHDDDSGGDEDTGLLHPEPMEITKVDPADQAVASVEGSVEFGEDDGYIGGSHPLAWKMDIEDQSGAAKLVAWNEEHVPDMQDEKGRFEPDAIRVKSAKVGEYEGELQLEIDGDTEIEAISLVGTSGVGEAEAATDGGGEMQQQGGFGDDLVGEDLRPVIHQFIHEQATDVGEDELRDHLQDRGVDETQIDNAIEKMLKQGRISEPKDGVYRA